jgi:hypothetical protein
VLETLFIAIVLAYLGFALGTPKALTWMAFFFKRMIPALLHTGNYFRQPDSVRGIVGQYEVIAEGLGILLFILYMGSLIWVCYLIFQEYLAKPKRHNPQTVSFAVMLISLLALNLPVMISYNYPIRFFLPLMPVFAVFSAFFVEAMYQQTAYRKVLVAVLIIVVLFSLAQSISVLLLFSNDARIAASGFLKTLPVGTSLEHTYYPPTLPTERFTREHNYPIYFRKAQNEPLPTSKRYEFNAGEAGLDDRLTDYLVIDSFTSEKFENPYVCADMQVECDFLKQLETGKSDHYTLLAEFKYELPAWLPQINVDFVNPTIRIYERTE